MQDDAISPHREGTKTVAELSRGLIRMQRKRLVASVAAAPLLIFGAGAMAQTVTEITTAVTAPVKTSTGGLDVKVTSTGSIKPTVTGPALEIDSNDSVVNEGAIGTTDVDGSVGIQAAGGLSANITNKGTISILEDYTPPNDEPSEGSGDEIGDGDLDGGVDEAFAKGTGRYGIRVTGGAGMLTGDVLNDIGALITIEGNQSAGVSIESGLDGDLHHRGSISVTGNESYGIRNTGEITGDLDIRGTVAVLGKDSVAVAVEDEVGGLFRIQGSVSARGYRYASRPSDDIIEDLDEDDLMQGGPAVLVASNIGGGILVDSARPANADDEEDDEDDDGIPDAEEGAGGSITSIGSSPALLIGSETGSITIGQVAATGDDAYGLVVKGAIAASGVYDEVGATALKIGGQGGGTTTLEGGARLDGKITAVALKAAAVAVDLDTGAVLEGDLRNDGEITAQATGKESLPTGTTPTTPIATGIKLGGNTIVEGDLVNAGTITAQAINLSKPSILEIGQSAYGVWIGENATVAGNTFTNSGSITAVVGGEKGTAIGIFDQSGTLETITNTGRIQAAISPNDDADDVDDSNIDGADEEVDASARRIAIDVRANTTGVTITQSGVDDGDDGDDGVDDPDADGDGVDDADEPLIVGDIMTGSGDDTLNLANGRMFGNVNLGAGEDALNITGGAYFEGRIQGTTAGKALDIALTDGTMFITETDTIYGRDLDIGGEGALIVAINPDDDTSTRFVVDTANIEDGAKIGVTVKGLLTFDNLGDTKDYLIIDAGTLTSGAIDESLLGSAPYIYVVGVDADEATGEVNLAIRRRLANEAGMNAAEGAAFDAVYAVLGQDEGLRDALLRPTTQAGFLGLYDQLLPDQGEGLFSALDMAQISIARAIATKPDLRQRYGPDSVWFQELNLQVDREGGETLGSEAKAFGFVAGYEAMGADGGALGATLAYVTAEEQDNAAKVGEQTTVSQLEAGLYWRRAAGSWLFSVRGGAGYAWLDGTRRFIDPATLLIRESTATWNGYTLAGHAGVQYEQRFGRFYARPGVYVDYFYLSEEGREENGGGGLDQIIEDRTSSRLSGTAEVAFGAEFGRDFWWRPEMRVGFRQILAGEMGDTVAAFKAGGGSFALSPMEPGNGAAIVALALKMGTAMSYLALEGEMEAADNEQRYNVKLTGRVMF